MLLKLQSEIAVKRLAQLTLTTAILLILSSKTFAQLPTGWKAHDLKRPAPTVVTPGDSPTAPPSDAIVLFNGKDLTGWTDRKGKPSKWAVKDGSLESVKKAGYIFTTEKFGDCQLHIEFASPEKAKGNGQGRGNSGVYLMGIYEVQVLDSFDNPTYADGSAGSLYGQHPPLVNASRGPGKWQRYDIVFRRPRFDKDGQLTRRASQTVFHNGVLIQDKSEYFGPSEWIQHGKYNSKAPTEDRLALQDHGNPVKFRNIWIRPLNEPAAAPPARATVELDVDTLKKYVGRYGKLVLKMKADTLVAVIYDRELPLQFHSPTEFSFGLSAGALQFDLDDTGTPIGCDATLDAVGKVGGKRKTDEAK